MNDSQKIQRIAYQTGAYLCPHFQIQKVPNDSKKKGCCGDRGEDYVPVCLLTNTQCSGVPQCLKLDLKDKSDFIKQWQRDLKNNKKIDASSYVK